MTQTVTPGTGRKQGRPPRPSMAKPDNVMEEVSADSGIDVPEKIRLELSRMKQYFPYRYVFAVLEGGVWSVFTKHTRHTMNHKARIGCPVFIQQRAL